MSLSTDFQRANHRVESWHEGRNRAPEIASVRQGCKRCMYAVGHRIADWDAAVNASAGYDLIAYESIWLCRSLIAHKPISYLVVSSQRGIVGALTGSQIGNFPHLRGRR